jgi:hypothetical protein
MPQTKVATCCYCGSRAALVLTGTTRHELSCRSCGAPLTRLKMLPIRPETPAATPAHLKQSARPRSPTAHSLPVPKRSEKPKKKSRFARRALEEIWDIVEDIFD